MSNRLKQRWRALRNDRPGERFREYYRRRKKSRANAAVKALIMSGGLLIIAAGVFFLPAPGPGLLIILVGATMIAGESYTAAFVLDWLELRVRKLATWVRATWKDAALPQRALLVAAALLVTATGAFAMYWLVFASCKYVASCAAGT